MVMAWIDRIMGRGEASITVPAFDGILKPNKVLDGAEVVLDCAAPGDLTSDGDALYVSDGPAVNLVTKDGAIEIRRFDRPITAMAFCLDGGFAVALNGSEVLLFDTADAETPRARFAGNGMVCVNALACDGQGGLWASDGSDRHDPDTWVRDLMERRSTGRLLHLQAGGMVKVARSGMGYAFGVARDGKEVLISESWRHQLARYDGSRLMPARARLPVYPSRISPASGGGFWLTAFTARSQLVEFVLREPGFRKRMMAELHPDHWIAPRLRSGESILEPMQGAHLKTMGVTKPWAPPRAYGLVLRLDANARPVASFHSRVDGHNHGITAAVEHGAHLYLLAAGPRQLLRLPLSDLEVGYD